MEKKDKQKSDLLKVGLAQISPVWLNREETTGKVITYIKKAAKQGCDIVVFPEAIIPGYPFWIELTDGARFNSPVQKEIFAHYQKNAVSFEKGDFQTLTETAATNNITVIVGCIERPPDRGGHSLYCSLVYVDKRGKIQTVHRKLVPTYEERLVWAPGDGCGLSVHPLGAFTIGALNCWENWMPLVRSALTAQGEDLHIAVWPGGLHNTVDITRFMAMESRSFILSVSGLLSKEDIPAEIPCYREIVNNCDRQLANGGSCLAGPDGRWIIEPEINREGLLVAEIDHKAVRQERHNFDIAGHYSRPDVTKLIVNRERQAVLKLVDSKQDLK